MNILVTGATGRIGSRLVPRLVQRGHSVRMLVRQPDRASHLGVQGAEIVAGDLLQQETVAKAVAGMDAIIHLAAFFRGATPEEAKAVNFDGTLSLARAALHAGVPRFAFTSTSLVYGPGHGELFHEEDPPRPSGPYPESKVAAERALMDLHQTRGLGLRIVRLAFVYGDDDPHLKEGMQWFRKWNPIQKMHLVHHTDVAQAMMLLADTPGIDGQIYNVADDEPVTIAELMQLHGESSPQDAMGRELDAAWQQILDTTKIRNELGFKAMYPALRNAVRDEVL